MSLARSAWLLLPPRVRALPADIAAVILLIVLTNIAVFVPVINETPLRVPIGLAFVLFVPGYAFIAALFPEQGESPTDESGPEDGETAAEADGWRGSRSGIDGIERVALSFGLSIAIVPLIGLVLNYTPFGIRLAPIMVAVSGFTLVAAAVAAHRRWQLPAKEQFRVPYRQWVAAGRAELFEPDSRFDAALNVLLVLSVLLAVGSVGYAVVVPQQGEQFTEFYLLTEDDEEELVAAGYPDTLSRSESAELVVGVENNEYESIEYTVVVQLQEVEIAGNETQVLERDELDRFTTTLGHNETLQQRQSVTPTMTGDNLRLQYLLFRDDPPATPTDEAAYRDLHLFLNVTES